MPDALGVRSCAPVHVEVATALSPSQRNPLVTARRLILTLPALLLGLLLPLSPAAANTATFSDTAGTSYEEAVELLSRAGILRGCEDDRFCPDRAVTRGQMASILARTLELSPNGDGAPFDDVDDSVHAGAIAAIAEAGITQGCTEDAFCPSEIITRQQFATLVKRALPVPEAEDDARFFDDVGGVHEPAVNALAGAGITAGCSESLVSFCPGDDVLRWQSALFLARAMDMIDRVEIDPYEDRRAEQDEIDQQREEQERREREEQEQREREEQEAREAERFYVPPDRVAMFERLAQCESNGNWSINTGNGFYGGLQFMLSTWRSVGGTGYPHQASKDEQIYRGHILQQRSGWGQWPACTRSFGWR